MSTLGTLLNGLNRCIYLSKLEFGSLFLPNTFAFYWNTFPRVHLCCISVARELCLQ